MNCLKIEGSTIECWVCPENQVKELVRNQ